MYIITIKIITANIGENLYEKYISNKSIKKIIIL